MSNNVEMQPQPRLKNKKQTNKRCMQVEQVDKHFLKVGVGYLDVISVESKLSKSIDKQT